MATVPNVVGASFTTALAALVASGLLITLQNSYAQAVGLGNIISQTPAAGTTLNAGGNVIIVMSAGIAPVAGNGFDQWGATGGGITAPNMVAPLGQALSNASQPENAVYFANQSVMATLAKGLTINQNTPAYQVPTSPHMGAFGFPDSDIDFPYVYWWAQPISQNPNQRLPWNFPVVAWINNLNTVVDWV